MTNAAEFVKRFFVPGSMTFLFINLTLGVVLLHIAPGREAGTAFLTILTGLYWLLSLPVVAGWLIRHRQGTFQTIRDVVDAGGARALVVVGNGAVHYRAGDLAVDFLTRRSTFTVFEAVRLTRLLDPEIVIATGGPATPDARPEGELIRDALVNFGVRRDRIAVDASSRTTREQISTVAAMLEAQGAHGPVILATTAAHMSRVMSLAQMHGIRAVASVTPELRYDGGRRGVGRWWPSPAALVGSESAMYEYLARIGELVNW